MKITKVIASALAITMLFACGKDDDDDDDKNDDPGTVASSGSTGGGGNVSLRLTSEAIGALPVVKSDSSSLHLATPGAAGSEPHEAIKQFFAFECHWGDDSQDDYCPAGIKEELGGSFDSGVPNQYKDYKLSSTTLVGSIAHADMYMEGPYKYSLTATSDGLFNFVTDDAGGDADKFVIDIPSFYNKLLTSGDETSLYYESSATPVTKFGTFVPRKEALSGGTESAFFQTYATTDAAGTAGRILAYNYAGLNDYEGENDFAQRVVMIINMADRKFAIKQGSGGNSTIVAVGQGGLDKVTGAYLEGNYYAAYKDSSTEWEACIDNETQLTVEHTANCSDVYKFFDDDDATSFDVATFLGLSTEEKADLVNFLAFFAADTPFTTDQMPVDAPTSLKHFPNRVEAAE